MAGDTKEVGAQTIDDHIDPLYPVTQATEKGFREVVEQLASVNSEIIRLDASAAPVAQNQHPKFRVRGIIVNPVTAGVLTLNVGTAQYPFASPANNLQFVPFPLLIERGTDMACVGADGRMYLIGDPE